MGAKREEDALIGNQSLGRDPNATPMSQAQFLSWKRQKDEDAAARRAEEARKREEDIQSGRVQMNGRELFIHDPSVFDNNLY